MRGAAGRPEEKAVTKLLKNYPPKPTK